MNDQASLRTAFLDYLQAQKIQRAPQNLYEPVKYIMDLGGKRMRPVLLLMSHALYSDQVKSALPAAYALEVFHNFTLLHDDIMDEAPLRRGQPTVHEVYDENTAILSGDAMMILSYTYLQSLPADILPQVFTIFNRFALEVCEGQQYDMDFETTSDVTIPAYLKMIELKTSVLLAGAMEIGALIGGANQEDASHLAEFGRHVGIAFQLQDDILDTFGDPKKFGKKVGGDIAQNKKTYLYLKALELADDATEDRLRYIYNDKTDIVESDKIEQVKALFTQVQVRDHAEALKLDYLSKGLAHLEAVRVSAEKKTELRAFAEQLMDRET